MVTGPRQNNYRFVGFNKDLLPDDDSDSEPDPEESENESNRPSQISGQDSSDSEESEGGDDNMNSGSNHNQQSSIMYSVESDDSDEPFSQRPTASEERKV